MTVWYEWDLEEYDINANDPDAEIVDHNHGDKLVELGFPADHKQKLVLVRNTEDSRLWAYVDDSRMLPKYFSRPEADGKYYETNVKVPQKFHREIAKYACG